MPLTVEDGTGVPGANSYITLSELAAYAADRGVAIDVTTPAVWTPFIIRACDYIESLRDRFNGYTSQPATQELCFPRQGIYLNGNCAVGYTQLAPIPTQLKKAQSQLVLEMLNGVTPLLTQAGQGVSSLPAGPAGFIAAADGRVKIREKLDVIEDEWSDTQGNNIAPIMPAVDALLSPLMDDNGRFFTGVRI